MAQVFTTFEEVQLQDNGRIELRKEQLEAIKAAKDRFKQKAGNKFLWNAKMRFGKTVCALQLAKELGYRRILIVTHRPVVNEEWLKAYEERFSDVISQYSYGTKSDTQSEGTDFYTLKKKITEKETSHFLFFASMQYLRRSNLVGGDNNEQLKKDIMTYDWDFVIVDEAHEGTRTELGQKVLEYLEHKSILAKDEKDTRMLHLSGTPFNLYDDFKDNEIYTWDYVDEQTAKNTWPRNDEERKDQKEGKPNPYMVLPHMNILTFSLASVFDKFIEEGGTFKFRDFFRTKTGSDIPEEERGKFVHENDVREFIAKLRGKDDENNFPFSNDEFRKAFRHTLWIVPGVKEAKAMKKLLQEDKVFSKFEVVNVAGNNDDELKDSALDAVKKAITDQPDLTRTITLSCGKLTTGTTIKPWTAVLYLKGSEETKAATYLQTIFRVQSPCTGADYPCYAGRMKSECYVFDFDYQRTLKVVAETAKYSTIAKKVSNQDELKELTQDELDKKNMQAFLDCCNVKPLVPFTEDGAVMTEFNVESIFKRLEAVYVDRLVTSGFNDKCLYDMTELNKIDKQIIEEIGGNGGSADHIKEERGSKNVGDAIDANTLTEEQKKIIEENKRRLRKEMEDKRKAAWDALTQEEQDEILEKRARKAMERKEFKARVSNIRGISLRIPLLMFGGADNGDTKTPLTVENFTELISDESWKEFMPPKITKKHFDKIRSVFKATRFEEAGKKYRALAKEADDMHIDDRMERITTIHSWFKNPDKETVLTPWNVVNMHLHTALGGYSFFDPLDYKSPVMKDVAVKDENGNDVIDENGNVRTESVEIIVTEQPAFRDGITKKVFGVYDKGKDAILTQILEINSKTGLYPLYMAYTLYRMQLEAYKQESEKETTEKRKLYKNIDNLSVEEEQATWDNVIKNNIFVICNTKMAAQITFRTLMGFRDEDKGQHHIKTTNLVERASKDDMRVELIKELKSGSFWGVTEEQMKFNAIVGNPPYHEGTDGHGAQATAIYPKFIDVAKDLKPSYISLITPSRWMTKMGIGIADSWVDTMLSSNHFILIHDHLNAADCFPGVDIKGGVNFFLYSEDYSDKCKYTLYQNKSVSTKEIYMQNPFGVVIRDGNAISIIEKVNEKENGLLHTHNFSSLVSPLHFFDNDQYLGTNWHDYKEIQDEKNDIKCYVNKQMDSKGFGWTNRNCVPRNKESIRLHKVYIPKASGSGNDPMVIGTPFYGEPNSVCSFTYLCIGYSPSEHNFTKEQCESIISYMKTKFFRYMVSIKKKTQDCPRGVFQFVPIQKFDRTWTDKELYDKYELGATEIAYIESLINTMT